MILTKYKKNISQEDIVKSIKGNKNEDEAASVQEISHALGYSGITITNKGAIHLLTALSYNDPVMIATKKDDKKIGHASLIVGARYSFVCKDFGLVKIDTNHLVFRGFYILDPDTGSDSFVNAEDIINNIDYVFTFDTKKS